jgi:gliding motility-associated-like protein
MRKYLFFFLFSFSFFFKSTATHLMGGSMEYAYKGVDAASGKNKYHVTLKIYRYCDTSTGGTAALDNQMYLGVYPQDIANPNADKIWMETDTLPLTVQQFVTPPALGATCSFSTTVCVEEGIYEGDILLAPNAGGYHLIVERCCRNGNIVNLSNPGSIGQSYYCFVPPSPIINSTPTFADVSVPYLCTADTVTVVNNAVDADGDSLVYSFATPYIGNSNTTTPVPDPQLNNSPYAFPINTSIYAAGFSVTSPFGAGGYANIDPNTGLTTYYVPNQGFYVVVIEIKEYRNGVLISTIRRDLQLISIACPPNTTPALSATNGSGITSYTITEGQTICFPISFTDPNGDSLYLTSSGAIFNSAIVNPSASLSNASGNGIVTSQFCWSTDCGQSKNTPYQFSVSAKDNGCPPKTKNVIYSIKVNPNPNPIPLVTIVANPTGPICQGTSVTFTATPTFGGTSPVFQWHLNGVVVGTNSNTYTSTTLANGASIYVTMTSNSTCVPNAPINSNIIVMVVNPFVAPTVNISAVPLGSICAGTNVVFTANATNAGATPVYQWQLNGTNVGSNTNTYNSSTLSMGNVVSVTLTSSANCPAASSNSITMTVNPLLTPSVTISTATVFPSCPGQSITFTAVGVNGGAAPSYQWQVNGVNVGTNSNTYTTTTLANNDNVKVVLTSNATCVTTATATSNVIVATVNAPTTPSISIVANPSGPICAQDNVIFTATPVLGGASPTYQWQVNGITVGGNSSVYNSSSLQNGDVVKVIMTSNSVCATSPTATSNTIVMTVNPIVAASVTIAANPAFPVCPGTNVVFTATPQHGGTAPVYQWQVNGANVGSNSATYSTNSLIAGDVIRVKITSNGTCVSPNSATSNTISATFNGVPVPSVSIGANPPGAICAGTNVAFNAVPTAGGNAPSYQWKINGTNVGTNSNIFSSNTLSNGNIVSVVMTSNANCATPTTATSNIIVMTVNPILVPSVAIAVAPAGAICAGTNVTFTATPTNGSTTPVYQWKINNINAGTSSSTFSSSALQNNDSITVIITSNALCASPIKDTSNVIAMVVNPILTPLVTIAALPAGAICAGTNVTFTATPTNGGTTPIYQWYLNNSLVGTNQPSYTSSTLQNLDIIKVILTSNALCLTKPKDTSNIIVEIVNPILHPSVTITASMDTICAGDNVVFTATTVNSGNAPVYQWQINRVNVGTNSNSFSYNNFSSHDSVRVILQSNAICVVPATANSNITPIIVNPHLIPAVNILQYPDTLICPGELLTFNATPSNGGNIPSYQWQVNGINVGTDSTKFSSTTLQNLDIITVILTSSETCALPLTGTSNQIIAHVDPMLLPAITISANPPGTICDGTNVDYHSVIANGGTKPHYKWMINGSYVGTDTSVYSSSTINNLDTISAILTSNVHCPIQNPVPSNKIIIDRLPPLLPQITGLSEICFGKNATMNVNTTGGNSGPYYYTWDNNLGNGTNFVLSPLVTTTYFVQVNDSCSTPRSTSFTIQVDPLPVPAFAIDPPNATILNPFFDFNDKSSNTSVWHWDFGDYHTSNTQYPQHTYKEPGYYNVELIAASPDGCVDSLTEQLYVEEVTTVYVPNSFTPNNDGRNDVFGVVGHALPSYEMTIFNRWGQEVYKTDNSVTWNGNYNNASEKAPEDVYVYMISFSGNTAPKKVLTGRVTLVR